MLTSHGRMTRALLEPHSTLTHLARRPYRQRQERTGTGVEPAGCSLPAASECAPGVAASPRDRTRQAAFGNRLRKSQDCKRLRVHWLSGGSATFFLQKKLIGSSVRVVAPIPTHPSSRHSGDVGPTQRRCPADTVKVSGRPNGVSSRPSGVSGRAPLTGSA